ncbi:MAG: hypothetical protein R3F17_17120 [Planctomycetota bacterium]
MERLAVVGLSWRHASAQDLARLTVAPEQRAARIAGWAQELGVRELIYLATCSRVELALRMPPGCDPLELRRRVFKALEGREPQAGEAERGLRMWTEEGAIEHLLLVVTGLDSAQVGETEILGQFREALELAQRGGLAAGPLGLVCEQVLRTARKLRRDTGIDQGKTSLAEIALDLIRREGDPEAGPVGLLGVSPMTTRCAVGLAAEGFPILWINRTPGKAAAALAEVGVGGSIVALDSFLAAPTPVRALVCAAGGSGPLVGERELAGPQLQDSLLIDFGVPPNIDPAAAQKLGRRWIGMEEILERARRSSQQRQDGAVEARVGVDEALDRIRDSFGKNAMSPVARVVQDHYRRLAQDGMQRLFRRELADLPAPQREALERFGQQLAAQMAHLPTTGLRQVVQRQAPPPSRLSSKARNPNSQQPSAPP